ncbi:hypothetical protein FRB95_000359 [Tulasnella sp. JGI-2019a]|nr:hypothetical protein FRB95_000359 [Tulasnella sp. JGI-2019a]
MIIAAALLVQLLLNLPAPPALDLVNGTRPPASIIPIDLNVAQATPSLSGQALDGILFATTAAQTGPSTTLGNGPSDPLPLCQLRG